jgi:hypothetical protein
MRTKLLTRKKERARVEKEAEEVIYPQARLEGLAHSCMAKNSTAAPYKLKQIAQQENICLGLKRVRFPPIFFTNYSPARLKLNSPPKFVHFRFLENCSTVEGYKSIYAEQRFLILSSKFR